MQYMKLRRLRDRHPVLASFLPANLRSRNFFEFQGFAENVRFATHRPFDSLDPEIKTQRRVESSWLQKKMHALQFWTDRTEPNGKTHEVRIAVGLHAEGESPCSRVHELPRGENLRLVEGAFEVQGRESRRLWLDEVVVCVERGTTDAGTLQYEFSIYSFDPARPLTDLLPAS